MITLSDKFAEYNNKSSSKPATILRVADSVLEDIQGSSADWQNNSSESQVDYATSPSNVIIAADTIPDEEQTGGSTVFHLHTLPPISLKINTAWQSWKQATGAAKTINTIQIFRNVTGAGTYYLTVYDAKSGNPISSTKSFTETTTGGYSWKTFDFSAESITASNNVTYWLKITATLSSSASLDSIAVHYNTTTSSYTNGQLDSVGTTTSANIGDLKFKISFTGNYYLSTGNIRTQNIDLGETPAVDGEWKFNDLTPSQYGTTSVVYTCFGSTDNFAVSNVSIGAKVDGDAIETGDWYRYYRVTSTLSTTNANETPVVEDVGLSFVLYASYSDRAIFGYEQALDGISSLSTKIDDFARSTVSQLTCNMGLTTSVSNYLFSNFPKNKPARILIGYDDALFLETDFLEIYVGVIDDWKITSNHYVNITIKDPSKLWDVDVPKETTSTDDTGTNATAVTSQALIISAEHPANAMLEILQNHINVRDANIDLGSFANVVTSLGSWAVTRDLTGEQIKADTLLNELRILTSTYFLPDATGKIKLKEYDSTEAAVETLTDDDFISALTWDSNIGMLYNKVILKFDWDEGTVTYDFTQATIPTATAAAEWWYDTRDGKSYMSSASGVSSWIEQKLKFNHFYIALDSTSIANNDQTSTYTLEDKWTLNAQVAQVQALKDFILDRYASPPAIIKGVTDRKKLYLEVGDMVNLTTTQAPSTDLSGITADKYQIIEKNFNQTQNRINFVFLEV